MTWGLRHDERFVPEADMRVVEAKYRRKVFGTLVPKGDNLVRAGKALADGHSITAAARIARTTKPVVAKLLAAINTFRDAQGEPRLTCGCGRPNTHSGSCKARAARSPQIAAYQARGKRVRAPEEKRLRRRERYDADVAKRGRPAIAASARQRYYARHAHYLAMRRARRARHRSAA